MCIDSMRQRKCICDICKTEFWTYLGPFGDEKDYCSEKCFVASGLLDKPIILNSISLNK